jgi:YD repeat-containing protein
MQPAIRCPHVTFSDSRSVNYSYSTDNSNFVQQIDYLGASGGTVGGSTWYTLTGGSMSLNEALLPADDYNLQVSMQSSGFGRIGGISHPAVSGSGTYLYARAVTAVGDTGTITTWNKNVVEQDVRSSTQQLIMSRRQFLDGNWEPWTNYTTRSNYGPVTAYAQPPTGATPGRTTSAVRDPNTDMVTNRTFADGTSESYSYNSFNEPTSHTDQLGRQETWTYDGNGNMLTHTAAVGTTAQAADSWSYSSGTAAGRMLTHSDYNGNVTSYVYFTSSGTAGAANELQAIVLPGAAGGPQPSGTISFTYDSFGRVASVTDPAGRQVQYGYDPAGRLIKTLYKDGSSETVNYNTSPGSGALVMSTSDRNANATVFTYDAAGRVVETDVHQGSTAGAIMTSTSQSYDPGTGLVTQVNTDGRKTSFTFDYQDRISTTSVYPSSTLTLTSSNTYDLYHLLKSTDYYQRATSYTYDLLDRPLATMVQLRPGGATITTSMRYDPVGLVSAAFDGNGNRTDYRHDPRNRRVRTIMAVGTPIEAATCDACDLNSGGQRIVNDHKAANGKHAWLSRQVIPLLAKQGRLGQHCKRFQESFKLLYCGSRISLTDIIADAFKILQGQPRKAIRAHGRGSSEVARFKARRFSPSNSSPKLRSSNSVNSPRASCSIPCRTAS